MATQRKRKTARGGRSWGRRLVLALAALAAVLLALLALTEPRQLPALIADHQAIRKAYHWRDATYNAVYHWMYPLASLREDDATATNGTGYNRQDRKALDHLLDSKDAQP